MTYLLHDIRHKQHERDQLARDIEAFQRNGGTIDPCERCLPLGDSDKLVEAPVEADHQDLDAVAQRVVNEDARPES